MNLLHLEYFYTVAKEGGFLRASEKLRINQPAISRMVANLEDYFGFKLFEKVGRNVRLTSRGEKKSERPALDATKGSIECREKMLDAFFSERCRLWQRGEREAIRARRPTPPASTISVLNLCPRPQ